jgi:hypothetical protein
MTNPERSDSIDLARLSGNGADLHHCKLNVQEFARWSGLSVSTANKMRLHGTGPRYLKFGRRVLYDIRDCEVWANERKRNHTSEQL